MSISSLVYGGAHWVLLDFYRQDPECAHEWGLDFLEGMRDKPLLRNLMWRTCGFRHEHYSMLKSTVCGIEFGYPLGFAAGLDKHGLVYDVLSDPLFGLGFGEVGGVCLDPQPGNERPRMWISRPEKAMCNWMGFNSIGAHAVEVNMTARGSSRIPLGLNIALNKNIPLAEAASRYGEVAKILVHHVNFFTIGVSSPNTPGVRLLQQIPYLEKIHEAVTKEAQGKPVGIKVSPDETFEVYSDIVDLVRYYPNMFIVVANTTTGARDVRERAGFPLDRGGVSGDPEFNRLDKLLGYFYLRFEGKIPLIACGGINNPDRLFQVITRGASLAECLTGFVMRGPDFGAWMLRGLIDRLHAHGLNSVREAVGWSYRS